MNHMVDGDSGDSCFSPKHKGCKRCEEEDQEEAVHYEDFWDNFNFDIFRKLKQLKQINDDTKHRST